MTKFRPIIVLLTLFLSFSSCSGGVVKDKESGLTWQKEDDNIKRSHKHAIAYCESLELGGYSDWRIPEACELYSLVDENRMKTGTHPTIDLDKFPNTKSEYYWTSIYNNYDAKYNGVNFEDGEKKNRRKSLSEYVRCVRSDERIATNSTIERRPDLLIYLKGETEPFTGKFIIRLPSCQKTEEGYIQDGKLEGVMKTWDVKGNLKELIYRNGELQESEGENAKLNSNESSLKADLKANLTALRNCIEIYYHQHRGQTGGVGSKYPGGNAASGTVEQAFIEHLTLYSNASGDTTSKLDRANYPYGPYLKSGFPENPLPNSTSNMEADGILVQKTGEGLTASDDQPYGWKYDVISGVIIANNSLYDSW